ncbi:hypothetical protein R5R35_011827 [Gryllus longicercus]|uniref:Ensconsin n=1 Tax=Gryllus longicercus TaxID=2509291 RepID=A0AAN9WSI0_9ORTH
MSLAKQKYLEESNGGLGVGVRLVRAACPRAHRQRRAGRAPPVAPLGGRRVVRPLVPGVQRAAVLCPGAGDGPVAGPGGTLHWFACVGPDSELASSDALEGDESDDSEVEPEASPAPPADAPSAEGGVGGAAAAAAAAAAAGAAAAGAATTPQQREREREREDRVRALRERQAEERARRLEELRAHAAAAQRFREQKEEERRRRAEELRLRDAERRSQVEERKRQIWEAERDRREAILRKNQEREARIDSRRRNERSSIVFAFGSSTPRMLEPADTGGSFWGARRATSTTNVALFTAPLTRRASERELADAGKKRATSAGGLDRKPGEDLKMSTSMYEVFHWVDEPMACRAGKNGSASPFPAKPSEARPIKPTLSLPVNESRPLPLSVSSAPQTPSARTLHIASLFCGDETDSPPPAVMSQSAYSASSSPSGASAAALATTRVNRRKTDLMPTIPSPRDGGGSSPAAGGPRSARPFTRSPGRAFSMSRLDQLAQPRRLRLQAPAPPVQSAPPPSQPLAPGARSMSRSMSHLARAGPLRRCGAAKSMSHLGPGPAPAAAPLPPPRLTRAERLRQRARDMARQQQHHAAAAAPAHTPTPHASAGQQQATGLRSGEVTPTPPSRPLSALSQQSMSSVGSGVNLRPRPTAAPRRPRPVSIAVTGVSSEQMAAASNATHRHSITGDPRPPKITEKEGAKPPLPKVHSSKKPTTPAKKPILDKSRTPPVKASPRATPKATPLQSPGSEVPPPLAERVDDKHETEDGRSEDTATKSLDTSETAVEIQETTAEVTEPQREQPVPSVAVTASSESVEAATEESEKEVDVPKPVAAAAPAPTATTLASSALIAAEQAEGENEMTASFIAKTRITTEEEAKAALAERRRLAREQAEREAELERQRQEEERRREEERIRQEEEEQRRFEEEQERLAEEARRAEEERLKQAILENQKREEEEKKRREEEARLKAEKEEAEKKAREEAERLRKEMDERLRKEEEERIARRKRVEAIMLRTRGKGSAASSTSAKGQEEGDNDEGKDDSPSEEVKSVPSNTNGSSQCASEVQQEAEQSAPMSELQEKQQVSSGNGHQPMDTSASPSAAQSPPALAPSTNGKASSDATSDLLIDTSSAAVLKPVEASEDGQSRNNVVSTQSNGHQNGMDFNPVVGYVNVDNVKQNNVTNNLLDLAEFDAFSQSNNMNVPPQSNLTETSGDFEQILDLGLSTPGKLANEDNVNSNLVNTNGSSAPPAPIIAFQDGLVKKTDTSVADLLS